MNILNLLIGLIVLGLVITIALFLFRVAFGVVLLSIGGIAVLFEKIVKYLRRFSLKRLSVAFVLVAVLGYGLVVLGYNIALNERKERGNQQQVAAPITREELWRLTNGRRAEAGKDPLLLDPALNDTAQQKCDEMASSNGFGHGGLQELSDKLNRHMGENLSHGYVISKEVIDAWAASPTHIENIIKPDFTRVGFGVCADEQYGVLVVQHLSD